MNDENTFGYDYTLSNKEFSVQQQREMINACDNYGEGFVE
jgi:hypothetical protein